MKLKQTFLIVLISLITLLPAVAQDARTKLAGLMQMVQVNAQNTQMSAQTDPYNGQRYQAEMNMHQVFYGYLQQLYNDPSPLHQPGGIQAFNANVEEYMYRYRHGDYRPYEQIAGNIQQFMQYNQWYDSPQGLAARQSQLQANNAAFQNSQAAHRASVDAFDQSQAAYRAAGDRADRYHSQYVENIHDRTLWVNPNNGNVHSVNNSVNQPWVQNSNGYYDPMVQYQNW